MKCKLLFLTVILYCHINLTTASVITNDKFVEFVSDVLKEVGYEKASIDDKFYIVSPKSTSYITIVDNNRCDPSKVYICGAADQQINYSVPFYGGAEIPGQNVSFLRSCVNKNGKTQDKIFKLKLTNNQEDNFIDPFKSCKIETYNFTTRSLHDFSIS
ncbi:hypothetical protein PIROE2DRAFT_13973 [Piromyces sp. E2]|nr:hypothetical protein PIROE2DRAFT_13973 [Piromyces sp. E2]|eukprot:OUM60290.1 hypothetical protein PIROE2DRAFT_13973 [Piromyces sp. E2]